MTHAVFKKLIVPMIVIFLFVLACIVIYGLFFDQYDTAAEIAEVYSSNEQYFQECQALLESQNSVIYITFLKSDAELTKADYFYERNGIYFFSNSELDERTLIDIVEAISQLNDHVPLKDITIRRQPMSIEFNLKARNLLNAALIVYSSSGEPITEYMHDTAQINPHWFAYLTGD